MQQQRIKKGLIAILYAFLSTIALNMFWIPGKIYASGITGTAQLLSQVLADKLHFDFSIPLLVLFFNIPLLAVAAKAIDREFTLFTIFAVVLTSIMMKIIPVVNLSTDPVICAVFGGVLHGFSVGLTLNSDFSTGGLDILGILVKKATGRSIGSFFIFYNVTLQIFAGLIYGFPYAFYSAVSFFISERMVDYVNAKQKRVQVMIVTEKASLLTGVLQSYFQRGITVINNVEGGFDHQQRKLLLLVISKRELKAVEKVIADFDQHAFISVASGVSANRTFYEW
ncbi:YitT family protein [Enterococcus dispar]|uniref:YitT family protein n=1 Tax=Enterococcus dispar TaxID=44009 RepID=UPI00232E5686|nr:YitT family protein [Enterococcus dispar]WCG32898.1 YitT family protein [Enterococcus dispar]